MYEYFHLLKLSTYLNIDKLVPLLSLILSFFHALPTEFLFNFNMNLKMIAQTHEFIYTEQNFIKL